MGGRRYGERRCDLFYGGLIIMAEQRTVFIIDDSEDELRLTERVLARISPDIRVDSAMSGEEGLAKLHACRTLPALTLLDIKMTGISGIETLRRIRADERLKNMPVAVMTNSSLGSDHDDAMDAGADVFLQKAFDLDQYCSDLQALLDCLPED